MPNKKNSVEINLKSSHSSSEESAFGNSVFLISQSPLSSTHLEPSTPVSEVQSPSLYLSKDLLSKLDEQSPNVPILQDKHFSYVLDEFIHINNREIQLNDKQMFYQNNKEKQKFNLNGFKKRKLFRERIGDWVCYRCNNLNFSFRTICNRCKIDKTISQKLRNEIKNKTH